MTSLRTKGLALGTAALLATALAACGAGKKDDNGTSGPGTSGGAPPASSAITIGTTDQTVAVDPAGSYDFGSTLIEVNIYQYLMVVPAGGKAPEPDAAEKCGFDDPTTYSCTLKDGLKFSNGDPLTAKDVAFSFTRMVKINDPNGSWPLLGGMASATAKDDKTVVFKLKNPNDQTWPFVLTTSAGPIVDSKLFPADKLLDDTKTIGSGPYMLDSYDKNQQVTFKANPNYSGEYAPKTSDVTLKYYTESSNLKLDIQSGEIDVAWRSLTPTDIGSLKNDSKVKVLTGAGGEMRYLVFNFKTMPGGTDEQKRAIRRAVAYSVDRQDLADNVYKGTYKPAYSMVPQGIADASEPFKDEFGESPDKDAATKELSDAGVSTPVTLNIQYTTDHYGATSEQEYGAIKRQLEASGLFKVNLSSALWTTYTKERTEDTYSVFQMGWFPDFVNADNFLSPFLSEQNFLLVHYCEDGSDRPCDKDGVLPLLKQEATSTGDSRTTALQDIQGKLATGELPLLPLLSGNQLAVTTPDVSGVEETLDPTYQFRMYLISKSG